MNRFYEFICYLGLLSNTQLINSSSITQDFDTQLNALQQSINILIAHSDIDPEVAQDITDKINNLNHNIQTNIQADAKDIKVAAGISSILEASYTIIQSINLPDTQSLFNNLKHAARINTLHKLITGAFPGKLKDEPYYIDPYTESIGFTINNLILNGILQILLQNINTHIPGTTLTLDIASPIQAWTLQATAGILAHYAWLLQKRLVLPSSRP